MKNNTITKQKSHRLLRALYLAILAITLMAGHNASAQINVTYDFNANSTGWTGNITRTTATSACGSASMRRNLYSSVTTGNMVSPAQPTNNAGPITLTYKYKAAVWSANTAGQNPWGFFNVQYSTTSATGPWTTFATVSQETQNGTCITKTHTFTPPAGTLYLKWDCFWTAGDYYINFDDVVITQGAASACAGTPNAGTVAISTATGCPSTNFNLTSSGLSSGAGISYQWQSGPSSTGPWSDVIGATGTSTTQNTTSTIFYRLKTTCSNSATSNTSNAVSYTVSGGLCGCGTYPAIFASSTGDEEITNVTVGTMNNSSTCATVASGPGSTAQRYANYTTSVTGHSAQQGDVVSFSITQATCNGNYGDVLQLYIDYNQNGSFAEADEKVYSGALVNGNRTESGTFLVPVTALAGTTRMRAVCVEGGTPATNYTSTTYTWGETEDYCFTVNPAPACTGTPTPGNTLSTLAAVCANQTFTLSVQNTTSGTGVTRQWQSSPDNVTYTNISGATNPTLTIANQTTTTYYRCNVTCSGNTGASNPILVNQNPPTLCYCIPVTTYGCTDGDVIARVTLNTLDNNSGTGCPSAIPGGCTIATPCSNFGGYSNYTTNPLLTTTLNAASSYGCTVYAGQYSEGYAAWIDYNDDGVFDNATERIGYSAGQVTGSGIVGVLGSNATFPITLSCTPPAGLHRLRVRAMYATNGIDVTPCTNNFYGEVEDYLITIAAPPTCPPAGTLAAAPSGNSVTLTWPMNCSSASNFDFEYGPTGFTPGTGTVLTNQAATVAGGNGSFTINGLSLGNYDVYFRANCGGGDVSTWSVTPATFLIGYCIPSTTTLSEHINAFTTTNGLTNINNVTNAISAGGYGDFTAQSVSQYQGLSFDYSMIHAATYETTRIWVDWNNNLVFEASEVVANNANVSTTNYSGSITVPITAVPGNYRMRVRIVDLTFNSPALTEVPACGPVNYGECEDYTLTVVTAPSCFPPSNLAATSIFPGTTANISWSAPIFGGSPVNYEYVISTSATQPTGAGTVVAGTTVAGAATTPNVLNYLHVRTDCNGLGTDYSTWVTYAFQAGYCVSTATTANINYISNVTVTGAVGNINNNSTFTAGGYEDYSSATAISEYPGETFGITADLVATTGVGFNVWVDWNQDLDFNDGGELVLTSTGFQYTGNPFPYQNTMTVPLGTTPGNYRMRLRVNDNAITMPVCGNIAQGETEDYTLTVVPIPNCSAVAYASSYTTTTNLPLVCTGQVVRLGITPEPPLATNLTYDMQYSATLAGPYTTQQTAAISDFFVTSPASGYYRIRLLCSGTPVSTTFVPVSVSISNPAITSTTPASLCGPGSVTLSATASPAAATINWYTTATGGSSVGTGANFVIPNLTSTTTYYAQAENVIPTTDIGTNQGTTTVNNCTPFTSFWESSRTFYLVKKSELLAAGLQASDLTSLAFDVSSTGVFGQNNFTISIAHTTAADLNGGMTTANSGFTTVYSPAAVAPPSLGWRTFNFDNPFAWNGNDNIIIAICHNSVGCGAGTCWGTNSGVRITQTSFNSVCGIYNDGTDLCAATVGGNTTAPNKLRPNMRIGGAVSLCNSPRVAVTASSYPLPQLTAPGNSLFAPTVSSFNPIPVTASSSTPGAVVFYGQYAGLYSDAATSSLITAGTDVNGLTMFAAPLQTTSYNVDAVSSDGCITSSSYTITVDASGIPNSACGGTVVPVTNTLTFNTFNTLGAIPGLGFPCGGIANQIWLKAVVPASGEIHVVTKKNGTSLTDITATNVALFYQAGQDCSPTPNNVACNTDGGVDTYSYAHFNGMTPGDTCYIRIAGLSSTTVQNGRVKVAVTSHLIWTAALNDDFNNPQNWQGGDATALTVPSATRSIFVPAGTTVPKLYANSVANGVQLNAIAPYYVSGGINLNGFTLAVKGNWNVGPVANASATLSCNGVLEFSGNTTQTVTGRTTFGNLTVNKPSGALAVNAPTGVSCILTSTLGTLNANSNLTLKSNATTTALVAPSSGTISGNVNVERKIGSTAGYHYLSSPVSGAFVNNTTSGWRDDFTIVASVDNIVYTPGTAWTLPYFPSVWEYDETITGATADYGWRSATGTNDAITPLKGFACVVPANITVDVNGPLNNGLLTAYSVTKTDDGFNMVGNPYASPISWNAFRGLSANTATLSSSGYKAFITAGAYGGSYGTYNGVVSSPAVGGPTDKIASSQGFIVTATQNGSINAQNSVRLTSAADLNATFFSTYNSTADLLRVSVEGNGYANEAVVYFDPAAADAFDINSDSKVMFAPTAGVPNIFTVVDNEKLDINIMGNFNASKIVPVGLRIQADGNYTIHATDFSSFAPSVMLYLEDTQTGETINLRSQNSYTVALTSGLVEGRFFIHFHPAVQLNAIDETCAGNDGKLNINYPATSTVDLVVKDANGNVVSTQNAVSGTLSINGLTAGNYAVEMTFGIAPNTYTSTDYFTIAGGNAVIANLSASASTVDMAVNSTVTFTATAQGATGFNWNFGDGTVITNGPANVSHTFTQAGTYNVTFEASNGICNTVSNATVEVTNTTGIIAATSTNLSVLANGNKVVVRFGDKMEGRGNIEVINMLGEVIAGVENVAVKGTREIELPTIAAGQYLVKITNGNKLYTEKVYLSRQ